VCAGLAAILASASTRADDGASRWSRWTKAPELQLHSGLAPEADEHSDRAFGNLRARYPSGLGVSGVFDLKWGKMPLTEFSYDGADVVRSSGFVQSLYGRGALGWRNAHTDVVVGVGIEREGWRPYLRWTSAISVAHVRAGLYDGGPWTQAGDLAHMGVGFDLYDFGKPVECDLSAILRPGGNVAPEVALSGWPATQWVRMTAAVRLMPLSGVVALQFAPNVGDNRSRALAPMLRRMDAAASAARSGRTIDTTAISEVQSAGDRAALDLAAAFPKDRVFTWTLQGMAKATHKCWVVEHESLRDMGKMLDVVRLVCTEDGDPAAIVGPDGPILLRTGCHLVDEAGLWRMPACPGALPVNAKQRPTLLLPLRVDPQNTAAWFVRLGPRYLHDRSFTVSGEAVNARCADDFLAGVPQLCSSPTLGWMWACTADGRSARLTAIGREPLSERPTLVGLSGSEVACRLDSACAVLGHCYPWGRGCVALHDKDCAPSLACTIAGQCAAEGGSCVARNDKICEETAMCAERGRCTARGGRCVASSQQWCSTTPACLSSGRCSKVGPECGIAADADCERHVGCFSEGLCAKVGNTCRAGHDGHCEASAACSNQGRCVAAGGACVAARGQP